jgi:hypothetical protein
MQPVFSLLVKLEFYDIFLHEQEHICGATMKIVVVMVLQKMGKSRNNVFLFILCLQYFRMIYQLQYQSQETELWFGASNMVINQDHYGIYLN